MVIWRLDGVAGLLRLFPQEIDQRVELRFALVKMAVTLDNFLEFYGLRVLDVVDLDLFCLLVEDGQRTGNTVVATDHLSCLIAPRTTKERLGDNSNGTLLKLIDVETPIMRDVHLWSDRVHVVVRGPHRDLSP
jgi:hypothetical protein